ncbi:ABC transporter permease [uncultured Dietzia sp.]|uniref:ABC transporter permease n=1 Tax=uncultured Dietzia sp. TaxID=395519 RepID=UPI0026011C22|nr:multidrug ABC transporter permease [uncultured Dietzia sp.]
MTSTLTGTRPLLRVALRLDVRNIAPWVVLISALSATSVLAYTWIFPTAAERQELAATLGANPALALVFGPARDLMTADGFNAWRAGQLGALFAGIMAILTVVRNSREHEDSGQAELIASGVTGRHSRLMVAVLLAVAASVAVGVVCFLLTIACGGGAVATLTLAATFSASGLIFGAVAAVTAQLGSDARTSSSLAIATLAVCFALRGYLDAGDAPAWTVWLTPLGWLERTDPGGANNGWPLLAALALYGALVTAAFALQSRRDFGQGLVPPRPGPETGGVVTSVWGLAVRLHRAMIVSWLIGLAALGALLGSLTGSLGTLFTANPEMARVIVSGGSGATDLTMAFVATILQIVAIVASIMGVQVVMRIHADEVALRTEPLYATAIRRWVYLASNVVVALLGTAIGMTLAGLALGLVAERSTDLSVATVLGQAVATTPGVWVLVALAVAAVGAAPRIRLVGWLGLVATFALTLLGPTFRLPDWALDVSPLRHVPTVDAAAPHWSGLGWLLLVAAALLVVGFAGYRHRDIG